MVWTSGAAGFFTQGMAVDPVDPSVIYVCGVNTTPADTSCGVWRVTPSGAVRLSGPSHASGGPGTPIKMIFPNRSRSDLMFVASGVQGSGHGIWRTTDTGASWALSGNFLSVTPTTDAYGLAVDPSDPNHILAGFHSPFAPSDSPGLLRTTNGGATWTVIDPPAGIANGGSCNVDFLYSPALGIGNANTWLYSSQEDGRWLTTNAGSSWTQVETDGMDHGGTQVVLTSSGIYCAGAPRLMRSTDVGASWTEVGPTDNSNWLAIATDGTKLYSHPHANGTVRQGTLPVTAAGDWSNLTSDPFLTSGSFELHYDPVYRRLWSAGLGDGLRVYQF